MYCNFKDGIIREGRSIGYGSILGNIKGGIIRKGSSSTPGYGNAIGNVKNDYVYKGSSTSVGYGTKVGQVKDFTIPGMEREKDEDMVACYHFLVKKFL